MNKSIKNILSKTLTFLPDHPYSTLTYTIKHKRLPKIKEPRYFNDKLLYLKLNYKNNIQQVLADKYEVRDYISKKIGEDYLIPLLGVYSDPEEVNFEKLPNQFVIKNSAGAQNIIICKDKSQLNWEKTSNVIRSWFKTDPYKRTREWPYKNAPKRFVIEKYTEDSQGNLDDYKFWCFNGKPLYVQIDAGRFSNHRRSLLTAKDFKKTDIKITHNNIDGDIEIPVNYEKMLSIAEKLSSPFPFSRIDLYNVDGKIYFGEVTFYPGNCNEKITPVKYEKILGDLLVL